VQGRAQGIEQGPVPAWVGAGSAPAREAPAAERALAGPGAASTREVAVDLAPALATAAGEELSALVLARWSADLAVVPSLQEWVHRRAAQDAGLARVLDAAATGALALRVDVDAGVLWLARHRRGVLVHALMAGRWAERAPGRPGVATMAARLGVSALPRARTTGWRALAAVHRDAAALVQGARAAGARAGDTALLAECARCVYGFGDGTVLVPPLRAVAYLAAGVPVEEAWATERLPEAQRPPLESLRVLAALSGPPLVAAVR
jgi:hypothetical protein